MFIDASAFMNIILSLPKRRAVEEAMGQQIHTASSTLPFEVGNGLAKLVRRDLLPATAGVAAMREFIRLTQDVGLVDVDLVRAMEIAGTFKIYAYDAYVLAGAEETGEKLLTLDAGMHRVALAMRLNVAELL